MSAPRSRSGRQLYALLPEVYRSRDGGHGDGGDLAKYLDACGELLDLVRNTLEQRLADSFPDPPPQGRAIQGWLLHYFAELLDARVVSPHLDGRREEVSSAIAWRQRKGTLGCVEEIAEAVAQLEAEVQEGWQRVAVTPRIGMPLPPGSPVGWEQELDMSNPLEAARHPGLPAVTPDFRRALEARNLAADDEDPEWRLRFYPAQALQLRPGKPATRDTAGGRKEFEWRQPHPLGAPRFPGSYEDTSRRTLDLRNPEVGLGRYHPRRLLVFTAPPTGFFPPVRKKFAWSAWDVPADDPVGVSEKDGVRRIFHPDPPQPDGRGGKAISIENDLTLDREEVIHIEDLNFPGTLEVTRGRLELRRVAVRHLVIGSGGDEPALDAVDCLFETVSVVSGLARLEYCTVLGSLSCRRIQASDCIFAGVTLASGGNEDEDDVGAGCIRYSRIPPDLARPPADQVRWPATTTQEPAFLAFELCDEQGETRRASEFGQPGHGVLHPATPESIRFGAEDGGEMGAYHHRRYCLQDAAILEKLRDFLPLGLEPVLIPDPRLLALPPEPADE